MKTTRLLRVLSLLGFLLLLAPFYDSCDGHYFLKKVPENDIVVKKTFSEKIYDVVVDEDSFNGYQIASLSIFIVQNATLKELLDESIKAFEKDDWFKDMGVVVSFIFDFVILISLSILIFSFTKKEKVLNRLALINSILILLTFLYLILLENTFKHWHQIKWGYYAFIITNLLIFYYSKKAQKPTELAASNT